MTFVSLKIIFKILKFCHACRLTCLHNLHHVRRDLSHHAVHPWPLTDLIQPSVNRPPNPVKHGRSVSDWCWRVSFINLPNVISLTNWEHDVLFVHLFDLHQLTRKDAQLTPEEVERYTQGKNGSEVSSAENTDRSDNSRSGSTASSRKPWEKKAYIVNSTEHRTVAQQKILEQQQHQIKVGFDKRSPTKVWANMSLTKMHVSQTKVCH